MRTRGVSVVATICLALAACSGGDDTASTPTSATSVPSTTGSSSTVDPTVAPTTVAPTTTPSTTAPPTTSPPATTTVAPTTTTVPCERVGSTDAVTAGFPATLSTLHGASITARARRCSERIVIQLAGDGEMPGSWVRYATGPITLGQTDDQIVDLKGKATLLVNVGAWMGSIDDGTVWGLGPVETKGVRAVREMYLVDNSEGVMIWAIGLDDTRPFRVSTVSDPARIVIDISTA